MPSRVIFFKDLCTAVIISKEMADFKIDASAYGIAPQYSDVLLALIILLISVVTAKLFYIIVIKHIPEMLRRRKSSFDEKLLESVERPVYAAIILLGLYFSLSALTVLEKYHSEIADLFKALWIVWGTLVAATIINVLFRIRMEKNKDDVFEKTIIQNLNKIINSVVYVLGLLLVLTAFHVEVTPLIASLGIGGLAVALALQSTLSNYLAGLYITSDRSVVLGDILQLDNGIQGRVERIGWRSTQIRTFTNDLVILPNSKLADMALTNYNQPEVETGVKIACGVGYESDLKRVEEITLDEARKVLEKVPGGKLDPAPFMRFKKFNDSNIDFEVTLHVKSFPAKEMIVHEYIKALHERYKKERIDIAYPSRNVYMKKGA
jgi:small-conductance mechanosensitive channel